MWPGVYIYIYVILWPPDGKNRLIGKDPDAGKDWAQEEKGTTEDEMVGRHHWLNGHGFGLTPGAGDGQGGLVCYSSWGCKESDTAEWLNWTELTWHILVREYLVSFILSFILVSFSLSYKFCLFIYCSIQWKCMCCGHKSMLCIEIKLVCTHFLCATCCTGF